MPTTCWPSIRGEALRVTKLDSCGAPVLGPKSTLATDGFVSVALSPQYEDGEETTLKNAAGRIFVQDKADDQLKYFQVEIKLTGVNPDLFALILGQPIVLDADGNAVGVRIGQTISTNFALEVWTDIPGAVCVGDKPYGYFLAAYLHGGRLADFTIENALADFTIQNAITVAPSPWGVGPYDVDLVPAPAAPVVTLGATEAAGGTFTAGAKYWKVTAITGLAESLGSNEVTATLVLNDSKNLSWAAVPGATGYKVYRGTAAGAENTLVATLGAVTTYEDTGIAGTPGTVPVVAPTAPGPLLTPILAGQHIDMHQTLVPPPVVGCAAIALA